MKLAEVYTKNQIAKLGNTIIFLCNHIQPLTKIQLLKLIFFIEVESIKTYGIPFFDLRFDVWKIGPISKDLFVELSDEPNLLSAYIVKECKGNETYFIPKQAFSDDEFSDNEFHLLVNNCIKFRYIIDAGRLEEILENYTCGKNSIWYITALRNGVLELLESGKITTTDISIDMSEIIIDNESKLSIYLSHKEFLEQSRSLKF